LVHPFFLLVQEVQWALCRLSAFEDFALVDLVASSFEVGWGPGPSYGDEEADLAEVRPSGGYRIEVAWGSNRLELLGL